MLPRVVIAVLDWGWSDHGRADRRKDKTDRQTDKTDKTDRQTDKHSF